MTLTFIILAAFTIAGTAAAMLLRNAIHCVLALTVGLAGLAGVYLHLGAQFVGFTQVLVYAGAVAILAVFAIMMTHGPNPKAAHQPSTRRRSGGLVALGVFAVLARAIVTGAPPSSASPQPSASIQQIGEALIHRFVLPLEIMALLLTAALIGAVILALSTPFTAERPAE